MLVRLVVPVLILLVAAPSLAQEAAAPALRFAWKPKQQVGYSFKVTGDLGGRKQSTSGMIVLNPSPLDRAKLPEIEPREGTGTGFVVTKDGTLVTCAHVVENATEVEVVLGGKTYEAEVVAVDEGRDLAVVSIEAADLPVLPLGTSKEVELAQEVRAFGYPLTDVLGESIKVTKGSISGIVKRDDERLFQVDAAVNPGNSGGPITGEDGRVVGVTTSKLTGHEVSKVGFVVPVDDVLRLLTKQGIEVPTAERGPRLEGPALARGVVPAVALLKVTIDPVAARGELTDITFSGSFSTTGGAFGRSRVNGRILADARGRALVLGEGSQLPFLLGEVGALPFDVLPARNETTWTEERRVTITTTQGGNDRFRRRSPLLPPLPPALRRDEPQVVEIKPATERYRYRIAGTEGDVVTIQRSYSLATLEKAGARPTLELTSSGTIEFDTRLGRPIEAKNVATLVTIRDGRTTTVPIEFGFEAVDLEQLAARAREDRQRAADMRARRDAANRAAAEQGGVGDLPAAIRPTKTLDAGSWTIKAVAFSPDGKWVAVGKIDQSFRLIDVESGRTLSVHERIGALGQVTAAAFTPDGEHVLSGGYTGVVTVWSVGDDGKLTEAGSYAGHAKEVTCLALSADGRRVLSGARERARCWDLATRREIAAFPVKCKAVWISDDGRTGFASDGRELVALDLEAGTSESVAKLSGVPQGVAFTPDGETLFTSDSGKLHSWSTKDGSPLADYPCEERGLFWTVAVSPDGRYVSAGGSGKVVTWDVARPGLSKAVQVVPVGYVQQIAYQHDSAGYAAGVSLSSQPLHLFSIEPTEDAEPEPGDDPE